MYQLVIIDDEPIIVEGLKSSIDWEGFHIQISLATSDPMFALNFILENEVHIVITDIAMPGLNGLSLIQKVKTAKPSTYVIVLSSYDNFNYTKTALRSGAENYLLKPLDQDELSDTISQIISHIKERDELKQHYGYSLLTFRSAFTEQWFKNLLSTNEFYSKAELLGINLSAKNYTVLIFSSKNRDAALMSRFLDVFLAKIIGIFSANFYFETPFRLLCVISPTENTRIRLHDFIMQLSDMIQLRRFQIFISVGGTVDNFSKVPVSYNEANFSSYLEYTNCWPYVFYENEELIYQTEQALNSYINMQKENASYILKLFQTQEPLACTKALICKALSEVCKNISELPSKYPALAEQLTLFPREPRSEDTLLKYSLSILDFMNVLMQQTGQTTYPVVDSAIKMINNFSDKDISLKTLAQRLNVTASYLGTLFHQQTGYYFNDYLSESRLKYAAMLLAESDLKIKDIVDKIGFSSQTYFNRAFKRYYNISPVNYRRNKTMEELEQ